MGMPMARKSVFAPLRIAPQWLGLVEALRSKSRFLSTLEKIG